MAATKVLLDAGPLIGFLNRKDQYHEWAVEWWAALTDRLWTCEAVLSEAIFNLQSERMRLDSIIHFLESGIIQLDFSVEEHRADILNLLRKYADRPMSLADACLVHGGTEPQLPDFHDRQGFPGLSAQGPARHSFARAVRLIFLCSPRANEPGLAISSRYRISLN